MATSSVSEAVKMWGLEEAAAARVPEAAAARAAELPIGTAVPWAGAAARGHGVR